MENRKLIRLIIPIFVLGFFIANFNSAFAYDAGTHAFLTNEVVKFYNQHFPNNKISDDLIPYLIDGSRREDDPPRWMNHFYDPVYNRGLTDSTLGTWQKSKDWAQDSNNQNSLTYKVPATIASILTAIQQQKISALTTESDFTWQRAINFYVQGEKEKAMFTLGHILHLIEDSSVPDHTRNDPHPGDSPYENYTQKFTLSNPDKDLSKRLQNKSPIILSNLNSYFDELAKYSNNNFYSKDTIGIQSGYELPQTEGVVKDGDYYYAFKQDELKNIYYLFVYKNYHNSLVLETKNNIALKLEDENKVVDSYWSRLSTKSVQYAAGIINLFFQEVEKAKNNPDLTKTENKSFLSKVVDTAKNLVAQVGNFFSDIFETEKGFQSAGQISLNQQETVQSIGQTNLNNQESNNLNNNPNQENKNQENKSTNVQSIGQTIDSSKNFETAKLEQNEEDEELSPLQPQKNQPQPQKIQQATSTQQATTTQPQKSEQTKTISFKECKFSDGDNQRASHQKVIINEVAWMGTSHSANDEWIELKNISGSAVDLTGWQLIDLKGDTKIIFGAADKRNVINKKINANGFYLLERTDDNSVPNITADFVYTGTLSNTNEGLRLFDNNCNLIDEVLANPDWPAGENTSTAQRKTMERDLNGFNWHTSNKIDGTPKAENTTGYVSSGGGVVSTNNQQSTTNNQQPTNNNQQQTPAEIKITEIMYNPEGDDTGREWIEIFNNSADTIDLTGWKFNDGDNHILNSPPKNGGQGSIILNAGDYAILANKASTFLSEHQGFQKTVIDSSFSLKNTSSTLKLIDKNNTVIDSVFYENSMGANGNGNSLQLINNEWKEASPTPGQQNQIFLNNQNSESQFSNYSNNASANANAIQNFHITYSSTTMELILNWQPPLNYQNSSTNTLTYYISEINGTTSTLIATTTLTSFRKSINEVGRDYVFSIQAFDQNGFSSATSTASTTVPSFLSGLYFYRDPRNGSTDYLIEAYYNQFPFIPDLFNQNKWQLVVFYLNSEADKQINIEESPGPAWQPNDLTNVLRLKYKQCAGGNQSNSLLIPLSPDYCNASGGACNQALHSSELEDNHFIIRTASSSQELNLTNQDYLSAAFYTTSNTQTMNGTIPSFRLVAIDKTKYYFGQMPPHQPPKTPTSFQVTFQPESENPYFLVSWATSTDPDSLDSEIKYQLDYWLENNPGDKQQWIGNQNSIQINVSSSGNYIFELKACDEFNLCSETVSTSSTALVPIVLADTTNHSGWNSLSFGGEDSNKKIAQSFNLAQAVNITSFTIRLANFCSYCSNFSGAKISLTKAPSTENTENILYSSSLSFTEIPGYSAYLGAFKDFTFFTPSIRLEVGTYFIVIEPENSPTEGNWNLVIPSSGSDIYSEGGLYAYNQQTNNWSLYDNRDTYFRIKGL